MTECPSPSGWAGFQWTETPDGRVIEKKEREQANKKVDADFFAYLKFKKNYPKI